MSGPSRPNLALPCQSIHMKARVDRLFALARGERVSPFRPGMRSVAERSLDHFHETATDCGHSVPDLDVLKASLAELYDDIEVPWPSQGEALSGSLDHGDDVPLSTHQLNTLSAALSYIGADFTPGELLRLWAYLINEHAKGAVIPDEFRIAGG